MKIEDKIYPYRGIDKIAPNQSNSPEEANKNENNLKDKMVGASEGVGQDAIVEISKDSLDAQIIRKIIETQPDLREEKVNMIKEQIESGRYEVKPEEVANKLVDTFIEETF